MEELNRAIYEGVVVDFGTLSNARRVIAAVRNSRSNKNAILFAGASEADHTEQRLRPEFISYCGGQFKPPQ